MRTLLIVLLAKFADAQQTLWGQCGGTGWQGHVGCVSGACCIVANAWYSQCLPGACGGDSPVTSLSSSSASAIQSTSIALSVSTVLQSTTASSSVSTTTTEAISTFTNPVVYEDFADNDIFRLNDTYYFSTSNMHFTPGAPILRSYDLVNWNLVGHSVPSLPSGDRYNLTGGQQGYRGGTWASTMRYRKSNKLWYWIGCIDFWNTYIYTATDVTGPWKQAASMPGTCYYDCGLLIDDDDSMYVVYGGTNVSVAQLSSDGLSQVKTQPVFNASNASRNGIEGNRLYKRNGFYYILDDDSQGTTIIWKSSSPFGPYTHKIMIDNVQSPIPGGGTLDQGSLIETQNGDWYFMSFAWAYPAGRLPVLAPIEWDSDGFPSLVTDSAGAWGKTYPNPLPRKLQDKWTGTDKFAGSQLGVRWEWNHNPDPTKFTVNNGLTLRTASVTNDLFQARNTLTQRPFGEFPVGTVAIDFTQMSDGDVFGLSAFRDTASWIGVTRNGSSYTMQMRSNATQDLSTWATISTGTAEATVPVTGKKVWFRLAMDARATGSKLADFSYSTGGGNFTKFGPSAPLSSGWDLFVGYRFGIFNFATKALGGSILVTEFTSA